MKAARLHRYDDSIPKDSLAGRGDRRAENRESARCDRTHRGGGALPHGHPRHRGPVATDTGCGQHASALRPRARELRVGRGGRLWGDQRRGRGHGDLPPAHDLRPVPGVPRRGRHALRERRVPRHLPRRRLRRPLEDQRPRGREAGSHPGAERHRGACGRWPHRLPRRSGSRCPTSTPARRPWSSAPGASGTSASSASRR